MARSTALGWTMALGGGIALFVVIVALVPRPGPEPRLGASSPSVDPAAAGEPALASGADPGQEAALPPAPSGTEGDEAAAADEQPAAGIAAPLLETVFIEADGNTVIAGRSAAGLPVAILLAGGVLAEVLADETGQFVAMLSIPPADQPRLLSLLADPEGAAVASEQTYIVSSVAPVVAAPEPEDDMGGLGTAGEPEDDLGGLETAGEAGEAGDDLGGLETAGEADGETDGEALAEAGVASGADPVIARAEGIEADGDASPVEMLSDEDPAQVGATPDAGRPLDDATAAAGADAPLPLPEDGEVASGATLPGSEGAEDADAGTGPAAVAAVADLDPDLRDTDVDAPVLGEGPGAVDGGQPGTTPPDPLVADGSAPDLPAVAGVPAAVVDLPHAGLAGAVSDLPPLPQTPSVLVADADGVRVLQPTLSPAATPEVLTTVALDTISYSAEGEIILAGRATGGGSILIYLDNVFLAEVAVQPDGTWSLSGIEIAPGVYTLRVDQVGPDGRVMSRIETPFQREERAVIAAVMAEQTDAEDFDVAVLTVQPGHTLWAIARDRYGEGILYVSVFEANRDRIRNPDLIFPGQVFVLPELERDEASHGE
ncbi:MAG: LysM peptidoglycan-binding domain-containing protein [Rubellimicrobium sp.]|nr:LysM peptidoglycan-binding domain-containing protein [Rubellimicrobium sp.]